jgi:hypothetical protein
MKISVSGFVVPSNDLKSSKCDFYVMPPTGIQLDRPASVAMLRSRSRSFEKKKVKNMDMPTVLVTGST